MYMYIYTLQVQNKMVKFKEPSFRFGQTVVYILTQITIFCSSQVNC